MVLQSPGRYLNLFCEQELPQPLNTGNSRCSFVSEGPSSVGWSSIASGHETVAQEKDGWIEVAQRISALQLALWPCGRLGYPVPACMVKCCSLLPNTGWLRLCSLLGAAPELCQPLNYPQAVSGRKPGAGEHVNKARAPWFGSGPLQTASVDVASCLLHSSTENNL